MIEIAVIVGAAAALTPIYFLLFKIEHRLTILEEHFK